MLKYKPINTTPLILLVLLLFSLTIVAQENAAHSHVITTSIYSPQYKANRQLTIYLPIDYDNSNTNYPVLYMHDGQNLFQKGASFAGEWRVDESLDSLKAQVIVVGIDHGGDRRIQELTPYPNEKYGGGDADRYLNFMVATLKPYIDSHYRTRRGREYTIIMGSSLGGLVSLYAIAKYPDTFGKAGVFSPALWFNREIYDTLLDSNIGSATLYFMAGDSEDPDMVPDLEKMFTLLQAKGKAVHLIKKIVAGGKHNEALWAKEFTQAYLWLMNN